MNLYQYAGNNPATYTDPFGLCPPPPGEVDPLCVAADFAAGFGDAVTFGLTRAIRKGLGTDDQVDHSSGVYLGGQLTGAATATALGAGTASAIRSGATLATSAPSQAVARGISGSRTGQALLAPGRGLNSSNPALRFGVGQAPGGRAVIRAAGNLVERAAGTKHINFVELGRYDDFVRFVGGP